MLPRRAGAADPTVLVIGTEDTLERAMERSEDSRKVNTSYVERPNLTIRRSLASLHRRTNAGVRSQQRLPEQVALLQCVYNLVRPQGSLRFGGERRTPTMQAGLATRPLTLREIFLSSCPHRVRVRPDLRAVREPVRLESGVP